MKSQADKKRSERVFSPRDLVYLKLQPYVQSSVAYRSNQKLSFRFSGPYKVLERIGSVAYKLDLPADSRIHPVVHVSQLKKHVAPLPDVTQDLSNICTNPEDLLQPERILQHRMISKGHSTAQRVLVTWTNLPETMATWEEEKDLRRRYPQASAWGQAAAQGEGNVTSG